MIVPDATLTKVRVIERNNATLATPEVTTYGYDLVGNLDWVHHDWNDVVADYQYDALNRLELLEHFVDEDGDKQFDELDEELRARFEYELALDGARTMVIETDDLGREAVTTYTYDGLNRLVKEERDHYDDTLDAVTTYVLDDVGNRLTKVLDRVTGDDETVTYFYDANDRLLTETLDSTASGGGGDRHTVYSYGITEQTDKDVYEGLTSGGTLLEEHSYEYNLQGRQLKATVVKGGTPGSTTVIDTLYNDSGIRIRATETVDGGTPKVTEYLIDASGGHTGYAQVLEEYVDDVLTRTYTLGHDVIAQQSPTQASGETLSFLYDGHGSTRALLDALGTIAERYAYDAFGNMLAGVGLTTASVALTTHLYAGEQFDHRTGLGYNRARYYDPATGRFNRLDPFAGSTNDPEI